MKTTKHTLIKCWQTLAAVTALISVVFSGLVRADNKININEGWAYLEQNHSDINQALKASGWQAINLPHTWNATDTVDAQPGYRRDASWYKKTIKVTKAKRHYLYFEGANMETDVYVNGKHAGTNVGGYLGFTFEITDFVKRNRKAEILVRVSNAYNPHLIPSQKSDFFIFGGITRDVWLLSSGQVNIEHQIVDLTSVSKDAASAAMTLKVNALNNVKQAVLHTQVYDPQGKVVTKQSNPIAINPGDNEIRVDLPTVNSPKLWSIDDPNLYSVEVAITNTKDKTLASASTRIGYRWFEFEQGVGFKLNGERVLLRGTHRHEEHAGFGAALSNEQHWADMKQIKNVGVNFVRLGHYPQDPEVYKAADELGLIIWDELPWCRGGKGGTLWEQNTESLLQRQILQNRNHASIAFWSIGNEMYWEEDFPNGGAEEVVTPYVQKLNDMIKTLDDTRFTTIRKYYPASDIVDIFSPSIWAGWYGGAYGQYETAITESTKKHPTLIHMEYGGSSHVGRHEENPIDEHGLKDAQVSVTEAMNQAVVKSVAKDSNWNENYIVNLFDWHLSVSERLPGFIGNAQWAFKDFGTPLRPENPLPYINQKGLVDRAGNPKDAYYVFASYWAKDPFCYIESKTWTVRYGPKEGRKVKVYCNTNAAELTLNGKSLGLKQRQYGQYPAHGLVWDVPFKPGVNLLKVTGTIDTVTVTDELQVTYHLGTPGKPKLVKLTTANQSEELYRVTATIVDENGKRVTNYEDRGYFSNLDGNAELLEHLGTPNGTSSIQMANGQASILVRKLNDKPAVVEFKTQNFKGSYITLP